MIEIKKSTIHGYGLFATTNIERKNIILKRPYITITKTTNELIPYIFPISANKFALPHNKLMLINSSKEPNVRTFFKDDLIFLESIKKIKKGEELFLNYYIYN
jgi:SET domain-containing protein